MLPLKGETGAVLQRTRLFTTHHGIGALPYRGGEGGSGDKTNLHQAGQRSPPSAGPGF